MPFALGIDYGTNSVRALIVDTRDGHELAACIIDYPSGKEGILLDSRDPHLARQSPADYLFGLEQSVLGALSSAGEDETFSSDQIVAIGVDTTGSSPIPVDKNNVPLASQEKWKDHPAAQCWLWKDHTSYAEAERITTEAARSRPQFIAKCGNVYSSEWFWSKIWHCLNVAPEVFDAAYSWVELADYIPSVLGGIKDPRQVVRGVCAAGHKALYSADWNGLPDEEFLELLNPKLAALRDRLYTAAYDCSHPAGNLSEEWAAKLGLKAGIPIAVGAFDVHYGAIGSGIAEGVLVKAMGTSTCDCSVISMEKKVADIPGICGIVPGAILPGFYGIEAGQSAVGDIFKWWVEFALENKHTHGELIAEVAQQRPGQSGLLALDWHNGNRTILVDPMLTGLVVGQTLHTTAAELYRAYIEATAFGARTIIERLREYGVLIERVVCCGGIAEKNPFLMQIYADVTGCTLQVAGSSQACALGSAIVAAVLVKAHPDFPAAQAAMTSLKSTSYSPIPENRKIYDDLYALYRQLHDAFGGKTQSADLGGVMKKLIALRQSDGKISA